MIPYAIVLVVALLAIALSIAVLVARGGPSVTGLWSYTSLLGDSGDAVFAPALVPSPGLLYNRSSTGNVQFVQSMLYSSLAQLETPDYTPSLSAGDMLKVIGGETMWRPPYNVFGNSWTTGATADTVPLVPDTYAPCPAGMGATGIRVFGVPGSTVAAALAPMCEPMLSMGQGAPPVQGAVYDSDGATPIDLSSYVSRDYNANGLYLTARNFLNADGGGWMGNLLMDQTKGSQDLGSPDPPGWYMSGVSFQSAATRGGKPTPPWKPTASGNQGDGGNYEVFLQMNILYYAVGDPKQHTFTYEVWNYPTNATSNNQMWQYTTASPLTTAFQYDASRTFTVDYGANGGKGVFKGLAVQADSVKVIVGTGGNATDGNLAQLVYYNDPSTNEMAGYQYSCGFSHNRQGNDPTPNYEISFNLNRSTQFVADYLLTVSNTSADTFQAQVKQAQLLVLQPTCTGVLTKLDGSNPITEQELGQSLAANQATCAQHAKALCTALGGATAPSPYCDCVTSTPIDALTQLGISVPLHCMSNGPCMGSVPTQTWMDYDHVDNCEKLDIDACGAMYEMTAQTIILSNDRFQCKNTENRCTGCTAGIGTCKAVVPVIIDGKPNTACRPKDPTGACGAGFVDCGGPPGPNPIPDPTPDPSSALSKLETVAIGATVAIVLVMIIAAGARRLRSHKTK
jgi:hypothetical protein